MNVGAPTEHAHERVAQLLEHSVDAIGVIQSDRLILHILLFDGAQAVIVFYPPYRSFRVPLLVGDETVIKVEQLHLWATKGGEIGQGDPGGTFVYQVLVIVCQQLHCEVSILVVLFLGIPLGY